MSNFIAICLIGAGSSYGRADTVEAAVERCVKEVGGWDSMYDVRGKEVLVNVFDVTGHDEVFWDMRGVHPKEQPELCLPKLGERRVMVPEKKARKKIR